MRPPGFWAHGRIPPWPLPLLAGVVARITAQRVSRPGFRAPVPVICCGNPGAGGSGKTPLALDLAARLVARGRNPAFLTRGHGGSARGPLRVQPDHDAAAVGDEALLLARSAPTYVGADRAATARLAVAEGADVLVMDDGLQNPLLEKTLSLLVIDGGAGFGNGHVMPAGPLREPVAAAAARCRAAVLIGDDRAGADSGLPMLHATLVPNPADLAALPQRLVAFAGIGRPEKFFDTLRDHGHAPLDTRAFGDHHRYTTAELNSLAAWAQAQGAVALTTEKDLVRIAPARRAGVLALRVSLEWHDPRQIETLLDEAFV